MGANDSKNKSKKNDQPNNQQPRPTQNFRNDVNMQNQFDQNRNPYQQPYEKQPVNYNNNLNQPYPNQYSNNVNINPGLLLPEYPHQGMTDKFSLNYSRNTAINTFQTNQDYNNASLQGIPFISHNSISPAPQNNPQFSNNVMFPNHNYQQPPFTPGKEFYGTPFTLPQNQAFKVNSDGNECFKSLKRYDEGIDIKKEYPPNYANSKPQNQIFSYNMVQNYGNQEYNSLKNQQNINDELHNGNYASYKKIGPEISNNMYVNKPPMAFIEQTNPNYQVINPIEFNQFQNYSSGYCDASKICNNNQFTNNPVSQNFFANVPRKEKAFFDNPMDTSMSISNTYSPYVYYPNQSFNTNDLQYMKPSVLSKVDLNNKPLISAKRKGTVDHSPIILHEKKNSCSESYSSRFNLPYTLIPTGNRKTSIKTITRKLEEKEIKEDLSKCVEIKNPNLQENVSLAVPRCTLGNIENNEEHEKSKNKIKKIDKDASDDSKPCGGIKNHKQTHRNY